MLFGYFCSVLFSSLIFFTYLSEAISELDELGRAVTPLDKCRVLQRSLHLMESGYLRHVKGLGLARDVTVATDDLIPLLAYLLVKTTKRPRVFSASIFIRDFLLSGHESSQIKYEFIHNC